MGPPSITPKPEGEAKSETEKVGTQDQDREGAIENDYYEFGSIADHLERDNRDELILDDIRNRNFQKTRKKLGHLKYNQP